MTIDISQFETIKGAITLYKIINQQGAYVILSSLGAGIMSINIPDKFGNIDEVVFGYKDLSSYIDDAHCAGKTIGRYANRISKGHLIVNGDYFQLNCNCGGNSLHGGPQGFQNQIWESKVLDDKIIFRYISADGEENFPGKVVVDVEYHWSEDNILTINYNAISDSDTVLNLTNHTYFNLKGSGDILSHTLLLKSSRYLPTDETLVPTGEYKSVKDTPMDFTKEKKIGKDINVNFEPLIIGKGYDHCWLIDGFEDKKLKEVAILREYGTGRELHISSTMPGIQVYTGNWLKDSPKDRFGNKHYDYCALAIECQGLPDAPNKPNFPSQILKKGENYKESIIYTFKNI